MVQVGKIRPFCVNFARWVSRSNSVHQHRQQQTWNGTTELKHSASPSRYVWVNKKSKDTATASQNRSSTTQITSTTYSSGSTVFISQPQLDNLVLQYIVRELQFQLS